MNKVDNELIRKAESTRITSRRMAHLSTKVKDRALINIANDLLSQSKAILSANELDYKAAMQSGMNNAMLDRLLLTEERIKSMAQDVTAVAALPDPIGEVIETRTLSNGLVLSKRRVPLGVIGAIYESRPNVTIDISSLCLKSANTVILRGGKEAIHSNSALVKLVQAAVTRAGVPDGSIQFIENTNRILVKQMLKMRDYIDLIVPRGGAGLINFVKQNADIPVIAGGIGVCHIYLDKSADMDKAVAITFNAKVQRPTVCNALDSLLVHKEIASSFLPNIANKLAIAGVEMRCDEKSLSILKPVAGLKLVPASDDDLGREFLSLVIAIKLVSTLDEAIEHIAKYGSGHSEAIITEDHDAAMRFLDEVDAACVYTNASTRFTDGSQFGLGAELGISTQKMHARGPIGIKEITSYKWVIFGTGQVRP